MQVDIAKYEDFKDKRYKVPGKKIHQVGNMNSEPDSEGLYSPTYAFKGAKQYMVQPRVRVATSSSWKEVKKRCKLTMVRQQTALKMKITKN